MSVKHLTTPNYSCCPILKDQPVMKPASIWITDGSSFIKDVIRKAGYAIVSPTLVTEVRWFPPATSSQQTELYALNGDFQLPEDNKIHIYLEMYLSASICTDSESPPWGSSYPLQGTSSFHGLHLPVYLKVKQVSPTYFWPINSPSHISFQDLELGPGYFIDELPMICNEGGTENGQWHYAGPWLLLSWWAHGESLNPYMILSI